MHEIEEMIRIILKPGPQRGRDVCAWINDAAGFKRAKIYEIATEMVEAGTLRRGLWALNKSPVEMECQRAALYEQLSTAIFQQRQREETL